METNFREGDRGKILGRMIHDRTLKLIQKFGISNPAPIEIPVKVTLNKEIAGNRNAQLSFLTTINLLSRLTNRVVLEDVPNVQVSVWHPIGISENLEERAFEIPKLINLPAVVEPPLTTINIGQSNEIHNQINIGNEGWTAIAIGDGTAIPRVDRVFNPLSSIFSSCLGVSEAFKEILSALGSSRLYNHRNIRYSLLKFSSSSDLGGSEIKYPLGASLGELTIIGAGALGESFLYNLASGKHKGNIQVIDDDEIEASNLNRLLFADKNTSGNKSSFVANSLENTELTCHPYPESYEKFASNGTKVLETVISLVDDRNQNSTRRNIQSDLPKSLYHLATGTETLSMTMLRVDFENGPCLGCLFPSEAPQNDYHAEIYEATGLSEERVKELLNGSRISSSDIKVIAEKNNRPIEELEFRQGENLDTLLSKICGQMDIKTPSQTYNGSVGFLSLAAGTVLAARVVADILSIKGSSQLSYLQMSPISPDDQVSLPFVKSNYCSILCSTPIMQSRYKEKWNIVQPSSK